MSRQALFARGSWGESTRIGDILRRETVGGTILLLAATVALIWVNSPWTDSYLRLSELEIGPQFAHLNLSLADWAADGLLAIFFFVVGLELKREFVAGDLREPSRAALPVVAAVAGMVVPALIFVAFNLANQTSEGWAIPSATDIAFAVAVLAVVGTNLPSALRTFLLTLAVVDDLLGITVIAVFYTAEVHPLPLLGAFAVVGMFGWLTHRGVLSPWLLVPLAVLAWGLMHSSGVHATIAGVLLGFSVPAAGRHANAESIEYRMRPISAGFAVPVFAFFAAGVVISSDAVAEAVSSPVTLGIVAGLVLGKPIGIMLGSYLLAKTTRAELDPSIAWIDVLAVGMLAGIGFTVSLLIGGLAFADEALQGQAKSGVLAGSILAAGLASIVLRSRDRHYRQVAVLESIDADGNDIPDVFEGPVTGSK
ncbi:MAG TPA: Na+/H+ antiporter NhaA [Aeromicrobium sp.]|nr:Na+/H+ antiporter NhaA [Aeromicrobium sp.]